MEVVGVVADVKYSGLDANPEAAYYMPHRQNPWRAMYLVVRTASDPISLAPAIRAEVWSIDKDQPVAKVRTMDQLMAASVSQPRFRTLLLGVFGVAALMLAAMGIYGVMSYAVAQRTREIGIRMALGARMRDVTRLVVVNGMRLTLIGAATGLVLALALTRVMASLLFGVTPTDAATFGTVSLFLMLVAFVACYIPARRATKVDPLEALRYE
jgi:putative ABC transport system permease protein